MREDKAVALFHSGIWEGSGVLRSEQSPYTTTSSLYSPNTLRITPMISPSVA